MRKAYSLIKNQRPENYRQYISLGGKSCSVRWLTSDPSGSTQGDRVHSTSSSSSSEVNKDGLRSTRNVGPVKALQNNLPQFDPNDRSRNQFNRNSQRPKRREKSTKPGTQRLSEIHQSQASSPPEAAKTTEEVTNAPKTPEISALIEAFTRLRVERDALDLLETAPLVEVSSLLTSNPSPPHSLEYLQRCRTLFEETVAWIDQVEQLGHTPGHAQSSELATMLGQTLFTFNKIPPAAMTENIFVRSQCRRVLKLLRKYNLSLRALHYDCTIRVAIREQDWKYSATLFWEQINPDAGNPPVNISVMDPVGLYAIARYTQERQGSVADEVMDAVNQMTMISPMNQDKYVLAAGTALGYANAWESLLNFLRTSLNSKQLGEPLVSATMHACILNNQHEQALEAFNERFGVSASATAMAEWQVGGGAFRLSPLCRDLAMRASMDTRDPATCNRALRYFQEAQKEKVNISLEALLAVSRACETTGNWEDSVGVLFAALDRSLEPRWIVSGHELSITPMQHNAKADNDQETPWWLPGLVPVLGSTLRTCNAASHFATALLCVRLFELAYLSPQAIAENAEALTPIDHHEELHRTLFRVIADFQHDDELLAATMTAFCGLGCYSRATSLFTRSRNARGMDASNETVVRFTRMNGPRSAECFLFATSRSAATGLEVASLGQIWDRIHRFTTGVRTVELAGGIVPLNEEQTIANELAVTMQSCTSAGFADVAICLARRTERLKLSGETRSALAGMVMSFLGVADASFSDFLLSQDASLAQYMRSYSLIGWNDAAIDLFKSKVNVEKDTLAAWTSSCNTAIEVLNRMNRTGDAVGIFRRLGSSSNAETFNILGTALASNEQWLQVYDLYSFVGQNGLYSEELTFLAMQAVVKTSENPLEDLRRVVSNAATNGALPDMQWLRANYWKLANRLGVDVSRRLMGWGDSNNPIVSELCLALDALDDNTLMSGNENDILWTIVSNSQALVNDMDTLNGAPESGHLPRDGPEWIDMLLRVATAAKDTGLLSDGRFFRELIRAFKELGGTNEIEELVYFAFSRGWRLDRSTLEEIRNATKDLGENSVIASDLEFLNLSAEQ